MKPYYDDGLWVTARFQFVWWGLRDEWHLAFDRPEGGLASIYRWRLFLGPLEVRRWDIGWVDEDEE